MPDHQTRGESKEDLARTGRDPVVMAAAASVVLAWYQYYVRGNKEHGLFIGLWPPTLLAFSNSAKISAIARNMESGATKLLQRFR